jgi:nicotinate-nucleotide adenylyltransferase
MRVGLFGGTFNPIHNGHLMVAAQVCRFFLLDHLYIIPCRLPPHKQPSILASAFHRLRMIELALLEDTRYHISRVELERSGPSYTITTVEHFKKMLGTSAILFLPLGMDAFLEFHTWKNHVRLLESIRPVVVTRHLEKRVADEDDLQRLDRYIHARLADQYRYDPEQSHWRTDDGRTIHMLSVPPVSVSSSQIRQRLKEGERIFDLVPPAVDAYIEEKELYR